MEPNCLFVSPASPPPPCPPPPPLFPDSLPFPPFPPAMIFPGAGAQRPEMRNPRFSIPTRKLLRGPPPTRFLRTVTRSQKIPPPPSQGRDVPPRPATPGVGPNTRGRGFLVLFFWFVFFWRKTFKKEPFADFQFFFFSQRKFFYCFFCFQSRAVPSAPNRPVCSLALWVPSRRPQCLFCPAARPPKMPQKTPAFAFAKKRCNVSAGGGPGLARANPPPTLPSPPSPCSVVVGVANGAGAAPACAPALCHAGRPVGSPPPPPPPQANDKEKPVEELNQRALRMVRRL